jgi:predicted CoA-substrate-specific enzyme activase
MIGAKFVQEVTAVSLAVERCYPDVSSVIELGGQDSKIIVFQETNRPGHKKKIATMNDKCAGGTGVVIEKIAAKVGLSSEQLTQQRYDGIEIHPVAGKCGVFAETDIVGLQKQGVPAAELIASLFDAIVVQNLTVLTRGHILRPRVLLLGGPHLFFPGLRDAWRRHLLQLWREQKVSIPAGVSADFLACVPSDAQFFSALGAIEHGRSEPANVARYRGVAGLEATLNSSRNIVPAGELHGLYTNNEELKQFLREYRTPSVRPIVAHDQDLEVFLGIDGGSTTTKAVALSPGGELLASAYQLSKTDPIADGISVLRELREHFLRRNVHLRVLGAATTGYSKDLLKRVFKADIALVETIAHARSAVKVNPEVEAIVDVGGQDIKIVLLQNGAVKDFRLNTQCSAGNGFFLQAAAESLGIPIHEFAETAFRARRMPMFSYGCAVFLQSDIVNFQRQGWRPEELIAGLAAVLPKNVFLYVAGIPNVARLGKHFLLQGGTQRNLAVVKAEVDFIRSHYFAEGVPEVSVHPHCGEAGAIGAALEAIRNYRAEKSSTFIDLDQLESLRYGITRNESTRCSYCANRCIRSFIEVETGDGQSHRVIMASCERGEAASADVARRAAVSLRKTRDANPSIPAIAGREAWKVSVPKVTRQRKRFWARAGHSRRASVHIGIPKVLNLYFYAPLFTAYFTALGIPKENLVFSDTTTMQGFKQATGLGAIDPCFPSKVCISHVLNLLRKTASGRKLDFVFFPIIDVATSPLEHCAGCNACPAGAATPEAVKAAFMNRDLFAEAGSEYLDPVLDLSNPALFRMQMYDCWSDALDLDWDDHALAVEAGFRALHEFDAGMRRHSRAVIDRLEKEGRVGLVLLGRPYHHDPGLNQQILERFQDLGYPVLSQSYLPLDEDLLSRLF